MVAAYRKHTGRPCARQSSAWSRWHKEHDWRARADLWDAHLDTHAQIQFELATLQRARAVAADAMELQRLGMHALRSAAATGDLSARVALEAWHKGVAAERLSRGEATDRQAVQHSGGVEVDHAFSDEHLTQTARFLQEIGLVKVDE